MSEALTIELITATMREVMQETVEPIQEQLDQLKAQQTGLEDKLSAFVSELLARLEEEEKDGQFQELIREFIEQLKVMTQQMQDGQAVEQQLIQALQGFETLVDASLSLPQVN